MSATISTSHPGDIVYQTEYHRVTKCRSGGYAIEYLSNGTRINTYVMPGDDAAQFADEFWALAGKDREASYLGEYLCGARG